MIIFFSIDGYIFVQEYGIKRPTYVGLLFNMYGGMVDLTGLEPIIVKMGQMAHLKRMFYKSFAFYLFIGSIPIP